MNAISPAQVRRELAAWLAENTLGVWSEDAPYAADDWAIVLRDLPSQPDTAVAIEVYHSEDELVLPNTEVRVQLTFRGRGDIADDFGDATFDALNGLHRFDMGDLRVQRTHRLYAAPLGQDDNARERRSDNYAFVFMRR